MYPHYVGLLQLASLLSAQPGSLVHIQLPPLATQFPIQKKQSNKGTIIKIPLW
jgi:hypothetical protein